MNHGQHESMAKSTKDRRRFRGPVAEVVTRAMCPHVFTVVRHYGRPVRFCSDACRQRMRAARKRATEHYLRGRVEALCPPAVNCWMCTGDFRGGPALSVDELPFDHRRPRLPLTTTTAVAT